MQGAEKYRQYAADCRAIAQTMSGPARETLLKIAEAWDQMARTREAPSQRTDSDPMESERC